MNFWALKWSNILFDLWNFANDFVTRDKKRETTSRITEDLTAKQAVENKLA